MEEKSIVLSFRFFGNLNQMDCINLFSEQLERLFKKSINEFSYTIIDKSKSNWTLKTKNLKYNSNNLSKFAKVLAAKKEKEYISFELLRSLPNSTVKSRDIDFLISYNLEENSISCLNFVFNSSFYLNTDWLSFVTMNIEFLIEQHCEICYCFILNLSNLKNPAFYVEGIGNENIPKKEELKLFLWANNLSKCDEKIWDIFWGNVISLKHIDERTFIDIAKILGKDNVRLLSPNLIWFNLNESLSDFDILKYSKQRQQLFDYFNSKHLIFG